VSGARDESKIEIQLDARNLIVHTRIAEAERQRFTLADTAFRRGQGIKEG